MSKTYLAGATLISGLVIAIVVVVLWALGSAAGDRDRFSSLEIAPEDSVFYVAVNTKPDSSQWLGFTNTLDVINARQPINDAINDALAEFNLIFEDDIIPLAGDEAYLAISDLDSVEDGEGVFVGIQVKDIDRAREVFIDITEEDGDELSSSEYKGVEILYSEDGLDPDSSGAAAFVDGVMLVASTPDEIEDTIDVVLGDAPSAADNPRITDLSDRQDGDFIAWGYADLSVIWEEVEDETDRFDESEDVDTARVLEEARDTADRISFVVTTRGDGIRMDFNVFHSDDYVQGDYPSLGEEFETHFADSVPADTLLYAAGYDLYNQTYLPIRDLLEDTEIDEEGNTIDGIIDDFEDEVGFDFEDDFISLLTREYALAANLSDFDDDVQIDVLALFDVDDPDRVHETMTDLGDFLEDEEVISVRESETADIYRWDEYNSFEAGLTWGVTGDTLAFGYPEDTVFDLVDGSGEKLSDTEDWQTTTAQLSDRTTSFAFVSLARLLEEIERVDGAREEIDEALDRELTFDDLEPIRSIGMASANIDGGWEFSVIVLIAE